MANNSFVKFENVQKSYDGETLVVKDLNLEIPKGEFLPCWALQVREKQHA